MSILAIFGSSFIIGLSGAMMPGPLLAVAVSESAKRGFWSGPLLVVGHGILELAFVFGFLFGLSRILENPLVSGAIGLLGGLFLIWMGYEIIKSTLRGQIAFEVDASELNKNPENLPNKTRAPRGAGINLVATGALVSLSNPYWTLWWATVGASYISLSLKRAALGLTAFYTGHILSDLSWYSLVSLGVSTGRTILNPKFYRSLLIGCGIMLIGLAVYFLVFGARALLT